MYRQYMICVRKTTVFFQLKIVIIAAENNPSVLYRHVNVIVRKMNWISNDKMHPSFERTNLVSN